MGERISFILNEASVSVGVDPATVLADYIRYQARLTGTKIGCREGDCGACTVLVGELRGDGIHYKNVVSCLMPLGNAAGKHIVTVEGLGDTNPIQTAFVEAGATQCGFCTPGFIVSLAGAYLDGALDGALDGGDPLAAISGNICRCTGYKSIERAVRRLVADLARGGSVLPDWFAAIPDRLRQLHAALPSRDLGVAGTVAGVCIGGGTDLFVQRPDEMRDESQAEPLRFNLYRAALRDIRREGDTCVLGASVTMEEVNQSALLRGLFPELPQYMKLIASQPIRNMATLAGNIANASPIGDMTIFLLALDAALVLRREERSRTVPLRGFFRGYKDTVLEPNEAIESIRFQVPPAGSFFNFEKVSKRTHLDIASVNTAMSLTVRTGIIEAAHCAAGGVAPIPLYLAKTSAFLLGSPIDSGTVRDAALVADSEIAPISDARGSADYKRLLFRQLFFAHFLTRCGSEVEWRALA